MLHPPPPGAETSAGALAGILVADFSRVLAGPYLTMLLADLGATVIKVEGPDGDGTRHWGPPWHAGQSTYFSAINRNKRSVVLDLTTDEDRAVAVELVRRADVLVQNLLPGRMSAYGLGWEDAHALNDRLVYCSISGFGSQPGGAALPGYDLLAQAMTGLMSITGPESGPKSKVGIAVVDILCGLHGAVGVLAALAARERGGAGQQVEVDLLSTGLAALTNQASAFLLENQVPRALGNAHPSVAPYEPFPAADGEIVIAAGTDRHFRLLCAALDRQDLALDARFRTNALRVRDRAALVQAIGRETAQHSRAELLRTLGAAGVPAGPINTVPEAFRLAETVGLDVLWSDADGNRYVANPIGLSDTPARLAAPPPGLDEHGPEIRRWLAT